LGHPRAAVMVSSRWILVKEPTGEGFEIAERMVSCQSVHNVVFGFWFEWKNGENRHSFLNA
jgi:hypothetical protein